jgi:flagellar biosynthesis protein FliQ
MEVVVVGCFQVAVEQLVSMDDMFVPLVVSVLISLVWWDHWI